MTDETETVPPVARRKGGWPKGKPRIPREPQRAPQRSTQGRTRTGRTSFNDDVYAIDRSTLNPDMDYQWVTKSVMGDDGGKTRSDFVRMAMNGWTPVDGSRLPQYGVEVGEINIGGLILMERPMEMSEEAREEDYVRATGQVSTQINRLNDVPDQLEMNRPGQDRRVRGVKSFSRGEPIPVRGDDDYETAK